jgi:hypothetical protein
MNDKKVGEQQKFVEGLHAARGPHFGHAWFIDLTECNSG